MAELLKLDRVTRAFSDGTQQVMALSNVSFSVGEGETLAIVGPSGSGKSTLLSILGLLDRGYKGTYTISDTNAAALDNQQLAHLRNREIGWVFQNFNLISHLSVLHNVVLPMRYNREIDKRTYYERALAVLDSVGLKDKLYAKPSQLSGGQQQRVAIARALANQPSLVLADEPTGNLDSKTGNMISELLMSLAQAGTTVIIVTHDDKVAAKCDTQIRLKDGTITHGE